MTAKGGVGILNCAHKLVITDPNIIGSWFRKLAPAHRNPGGALYEFKLTTVISNIPNMPDTKKGAIKNSRKLQVQVGHLHSRN